MTSAIDILEFGELIEELTEGRVSRHGLSPQSRFLEDIGLDSMGMMALLFMCETRFGISLMQAGDGVPKMVTVGHAMSFMQSLEEAARC